MDTRKTSIAIDIELLESAKEILGTSTVKETVHQALIEVLQKRARSNEVAALSDMKGLDLANARVMSGAWRK